jgi:hypothetical protein
MVALVQIGRIVHGHQWSDPAEWVEALDALADLSDGEIEVLAATGRLKAEIPPLPVQR